MKKILIMTGSLNIGGIEKALLEMLKIIPYNKYDVTLLLEEYEGAYLNEIPERVNIITDKTIKYCLYSSRINQIKESLKTFKFGDAVSILVQSAVYSITHNCCRYFNWQCKRMPKLQQEYDVAIAYHNPGRFPGNYIINNVKAAKKILWNHTDLCYSNVNLKGFGKLCQKFDYVYSVSKAAKESFDKLFPKLANKSKVFYNVINREEIIKKSSEYFVEAKKHPILLTVGRLSPEKGQDRIPDIAQILRDRQCEFVWYIVGGGGLEAAIAEKITKYQLQDYIVLTGNKNNPYPYMKACDIYVQTSWQEGFPMVIGEVMTFNKPCIVTDVGGTKEYFTNSNVGIVVRNNTDEFIADEIYSLINDKMRYREISENIAKVPERDYQETFCKIIEGE